MADDLAVIIAAGYLDGIDTWNLDDVRARRERAQAIENGVSYVRRLVHGRLDIVRGELRRRNEGGGPSDLDDLISRLPTLLSDGSRSDALPRPPQDLSPDDDAQRLVDEMDARFPVSLMGSVPDLADEALATLTEDLRAYEHEVSAHRSDLHRVIDALHAEIIRRYRAGDASVESLLG